MKVERETYTEVVHSLIMAVLERELDIPQVAMLMHHIAQPEATEARIDITNEVRAALDDWSQESKGLLIGIEVVHVRFPCHNAHGGGGDDQCEEGFHVLQMTRVIGSTRFDPETVTSRHKFEDVVVRISTAHHPKSADMLRIAGHGGRGKGGSGLAESFKRIFGEQAKQDIDRKVEDFRKELDDLFPAVNPQPGKEDGHESS